MNFTQRFNGFNPGRFFPLSLRAALLCLVATGWFSTELLQAGGKPPEAALRIHLQAGQGMPREQTVPVNLIDPPQAIAVRRLPELTEKHIDWIEKMPDGRILITFNTVGANLLEGSTSQSMGAIMVVICNGRVVYAPVIDVPLRTGKIILPGGITDGEIIIFQKMIARKKRT